MSDFKAPNAPSSQNIFPRWIIKRPYKPHILTGAVSRKWNLLTWSLVNSRCDLYLFLWNQKPSIFAGSISSRTQTSCRSAPTIKSWWLSIGRETEQEPSWIGTGPSRSKHSLRKNYAWKSWLGSGTNACKVIATFPQFCVCSWEQWTKKHATPLILWLSLDGTLKINLVILATTHCWCLTCGCSNIYISWSNMHSWMRFTIIRQWNALLKRTTLPYGKLSIDSSPVGGGRRYLRYEKSTTHRQTNCPGMFSGTSSSKSWPDETIRTLKAPTTKWGSKTIHLLYVYIYI